MWYYTKSRLRVATVPSFNEWYWTHSHIEEWNGRAYCYLAVRIFPIFMSRWMCYHRSIISWSRLLRIDDAGHAILTLYFCILQRNVIVKLQWRCFKKSPTLVFLHEENSYIEDDYDEVKVYCMLFGECWFAQSNLSCSIEWFHNRALKGEFFKILKLRATTVVAFQQIAFNSTHSYGETWSTNFAYMPNRLRQNIRSASCSVKRRFQCLAHWDIVNTMALFWPSIL